MKSQQTVSVNGIFECSVAEMQEGSISNANIESFIIRIGLQHQSRYFKTTPCSLRVENYCAGILLIHMGKTKIYLSAYVYPKNSHSRRTSHAIPAWPQSGLLF